MKHWIWVAWDNVRNWVRWHPPGARAALESQASLDEISERLDEVSRIMIHLAVDLAEHVGRHSGSPPPARRLRAVDGGGSPA